MASFQSIVAAHSLKKENIADVFEKKRKKLTELAEEYKEVSVPDAVDFAPGNEAKIHNAQYMKYLAEIHVLKALDPETLPNDPDFLLEGSKNYIEEKIKRLQAQLSMQEEIAEKLNQKTKSSATDEGVLIMLKSLHKKLTNRLKKLLTVISPAEQENDSSLENSEMNGCPELFDIMKAFFPEIESQSLLNLFEVPPMEVNGEIENNVKALNLLLEYNLIEVLKRDPLTVAVKD